jgi:hypothetical protein
MVRAPGVAVVDCSTHRASRASEAISVRNSKVQYTYSQWPAGENHNRLTLIIYPSGRKVHVVYDAGLDESISRLSAFADDSGGAPGTRIEAYSYLGLDTIIKRAHVQPGVGLTYVQQAGDPNANTTAGDQYTGLDRFGRVIDQNWLKSSAGASTDRFQYGYDRAGHDRPSIAVVIDDHSVSEVWTPRTTS